MMGVFLFVLSVLLANVGGWGACISYDFNSTGFNTNVWQERGYGCTNNQPIMSMCEYYIGGSAPSNGDVTPRGYCIRKGIMSNGAFCSGNQTFCRYYGICCSTQCEADSVKGCDNDHIWNQDSCKCVPKPEPEADSSFTICTEDVRNGTPYATIYGVTCHYKNGVAETCCGVSAGSISGTGYQSHCPQLRSVRGSCENNGVPNGPSKQTAGKQVPDLPNSQCYAVVGYTCYMRDYNSGNTYSCECDGDCQEAFRQQMQGYGCRNPYPQPQPSSSGSGGGESSPSSSGSGESSPSSSDSEPPSSSGSGGGDKDYTEQLNQIIANTQGTMNNTADISQWTQTTMNNTTDIKNSLSEIGVDVSHIRTNTENTATNTAQVATNTNNIDNKLSTTNSLLQQLNNKNWSPNINITDTNIVNVDNEVIINGDTAKAPSEILSFLKGVFGGMDTTANYDTTGWGRTNDSAKAQLDSALKKGDWVTSLGCDTTGGRKCDNSVIGAHGLDSAKSSLKATFAQFGDTLKNGAFGDSLKNWSNKFTAGNISGSGSDNCPSVLSRNYHIELVQGAGFDLTLGRFLCQPLVGNTTGWALCRLLLRASVALACMWFLFHCATGFGGRGGDDD
jgi:hypothetical protein